MVDNDLIDFDDLELRVAVKAIIIKQNENDSEEKLLILKRVEHDTYGGIWELPGGRLEKGEDPEAGIIREVKEETNLDVDVKVPVTINHFIRKDGQEIVMIIYLCSIKENSDDVKVSHEHTDSNWATLKDAKAKVFTPIISDIEDYEKLRDNKF